MEMVLGDCLKLERYEVGGDPGKIILGQKRCSTDTDIGQAEPKKMKSEENSIDYKKSSSWTLWSLVWPRRKQVVNEISYHFTIYTIHYCIVDRLRNRERDQDDSRVGGCHY